MDIDLSPFPNNPPFHLVKDHMKNFSSTRYVGRIISCYRVSDQIKPKSFIATRFCGAVPFDLHKLCGIFFPVWIVLALIPEEKERNLTIENIVVAHNEDRLIPNDAPQISIDLFRDIFHPLVGKGSLIIKKLTFVCPSSKLCNSMKELKERLRELGNITFEYFKLKVVIDSTDNFTHFLEKLDVVSDGADEVKIMLGDDELGKIALNEADMNEISTRLEDDDFETEVPILEGTVLEGTYDSPHFMLAESYVHYRTKVNHLHWYEDMTASRILIATLGHGCADQILKSNFTYMYDDELDIMVSGQKYSTLQVIAKKNFTNDTAPVYHDCYTSPWIIDDYTKEAKFVICQTTYCNEVIANGATSKAIKWLREKWKETWKDEYDNLVVLIPYGGQYMEDEMIQIHEATNEGIIIVCAAGGVGDVVFPAALGTVLSVGVSNRGPKGREVDIHIPEESLKRNNNGMYVDHDLSNHLNIELPKDCGYAAARITGHLALLLSRINFILNSNLTDPCNKEMASAIKKIPHYLHTCVIRELLVNEGNGSHDPQLGYGDGEDILLYLFKIDESTLLQKLADVFFKDDQALRTNNQIIPTNTSNEDETRKKLFYNLDGSGISVAVLDRDIEADIEKGEFETTFKSFKKSSRHGEQCADIVHALCPNASILCANNVEDDLSLGFYDCTHRSPSIDIISYSISSPFFDLNMCTAVNEAVVAGKIIVFAAGNTGQKHRNTIGYPGRIGNILVVGGRDPHYNRIGFSSVGREMDFLAEGETGDLRGTSYAAPVVAGYIALLLQFIKENMNTDEDRIRAWSKNSQDEYEWQDIPAFDAAHNVYAMRTLLKLLVPKPQDHSDTEGFGCLVFSTLFPYYAIPNGHEFTTNLAKKKIRDSLQVFYRYNFMNKLYNK